MCRTASSLLYYLTLPHASALKKLARHSNVRLTNLKPANGRGCSAV